MNFETIKTNEFAPVSIEKFTKLDEFKNRLDQENIDLSTTSQEMREAGKEVKDQNFYIKQFHYNAEKPNKPALLIIGGMGPLAGIQAGQAAVEKLQENQKNISLYQLTATPDRTAGIEEKNNGDDTKYNQVIRVIKKGVLTAARNVKTGLGNDKAKIVIICNTAHNYVADLKKELPEGNEIVSIIDSTAEHLKKETENDSNTKVAAMYTDGTKKQKLYSDEFNRYKIDYEEPDDDSQQYLMKAIYDGVKAFNTKETLINGEKALQYLVARNDITHLLAGCTEIPEVISVVKNHSKDQNLVQRLNTIKIVNPVEQAFEKAIEEK